MCDDGCCGGNGGGTMWWWWWLRLLSCGRNEGGDANCRMDRIRYGGAMIWGGMSLGRLVAMVVMCGR